jgi:hypothetical protein
VRAAEPSSGRPRDADPAVDGRVVEPVETPARGESGDPVETAASDEPRDPVETARPAEPVDPPPHSRRRRRVTTPPPAGSDPSPSSEPARHALTENDDRLRAEKPPHY